MAFAPGAAAATGPQFGLIQLDSRLEGKLEIFGADGAPVATLLPPAGETFPRPWFLSSVSFSGDGQLLVAPGVSRSPTRRAGGPALGLYAVPADGGVPALIRGTRSGLNPVASPDGRSVVFMRSRGTNSETVEGDHVIRRTRARTSIWIASLDGSGARRLTPWRVDGYDVPTSISPDGTTLALTRVTIESSSGKRPTRRSQALLLDLATGGTVPLGGRIGSATFSPDGTRLAVVIVHRFARPHVRETKSGKSVLYGESDIYVEDRITGVLTRLTSGPSSALDPAWDPSGQRLAFRRFGNLLGEEQAVYGVGDSIYEVNADGSCLTRVLHDDEGGFTAPAWRPGPERGAGAISCAPGG